METWMNSNRALTFLFCLFSFVLAGCGHSSSNNANLRIVNAIPDAPSVSVQLGTNPPLVTGLLFQQLTQYMSVSGGSQDFMVSANGGMSFAINQTLSLSNGSYTYVVYGPIVSATAILINENNFPTPNSGAFNFRVINVAAGIGPVDVYLTPLGTDLNATSPTVSNVGLGAIGSFVNVNAGTLELRATATGTKNVIYDTAVQAFTSGSSYEAVVFTKGSSRLVSVALLDENSTGTGQVNDNLLAEFKVVNASTAGTALNVLANGVIALSNIPYQGVSNYVTTPAGSSTFTVQATATPGANLLTLVATLDSATDTSLVFSGPTGGLIPLVLNDNNLPPPALNARVRFVNASPGLGPVDVYINFSQSTAALAENSASLYINETADGTIGTAYEFDFNIAGTTTPVLKLPGVVIIAGHTYTVYVVGPSNAPQGVVSQDD
jgi:Domain of unknown function (DUF4397)